MGKDNPTVNINARLDNNTLIVTVVDSGKGIRNEIKDKVFNMFYRGTDKAKGSGLGLYIAREMVQKMKGKLEFTTQAGKGTSFIVSIPTAIA
jgi:signal transduction histidine kinase